MVINKYKTAREYKTYKRANLPPELVKALQETIRQGELSDRSPLIPVLEGNRAGQAMDAGSFSNFARDTMQKVSRGTKLGVNILRHSKITNFLEDKTRSENQRLALAKEMGHSKAQQLKYLKLG